MSYDHTIYVILQLLKASPIWITTGCLVLVFCISTAFVYKAIKVVITYSFKALLAILLACAIQFAINRYSGIDIKTSVSPQHHHQSSVNTNQVHQIVQDKIDSILQANAIRSQSIPSNNNWGKYDEYTEFIKQHFPTSWFNQPAWELVGVEMQTNEQVSQEASENREGETPNRN
jgi:hypothetical protein